MQLISGSLFASPKETANTLGQIAKSARLVLCRLLVNIGIADLVTHKVKQVRRCWDGHEPRHQVDGLELLVDAKLFEVGALVAIRGDWRRLAEQVEVLEDDLLLVR